MKKYLIILTLFLSTVSYSQKITRGPDIGEIYFLGPINTGTGLYYSTDFGETAVCVDSVMDFITIATDITQGGVYCVEMPSNLYYSENYGYSNSWEVKNGGISSEIISGVNAGHIFSSFFRHSEDFGLNFIYHTCNGYFGNKKNFTFDNVEQNVGYVISHKLTVADTVYLFRTYDTFENLELIRTFNYHWSESIELLRGFISGELYFFNHTRNELWFSNNYADSLDLIDTFNFSDYYQISSDAGKQEGEFFILYNFVNLMWQNAHIYIFHSTDYGNTFDVYHPFSKGNEPILANFSTVDKKVLLTIPIEFSNFSIGEITEYQWDFDNDGIIDSYDEFPIHVYQDTGYYSVKLSVVGQDSTNTFIKENYIHVIDTITNIPDLNYQTINIYPNPFSDKISIETRPDFKMIEIYDLNGKSHFSKTLLQENKTEIIDLKNLEKGIYILKLKMEKQNITKKIIKI